MCRNGTHGPFFGPHHHATLVAELEPDPDMKPEARLAQWLMASVFLVMGGYRLWQAMHGAPIANGTLVFSALEFVLAWPSPQAGGCGWSPCSLLH